MDQTPDITPQTATISEEMSDDVGRMMGALSVKYQRQPRVLALALTRSLGVFIALNTDDTLEALGRAALVLANTPHEEIRKDHFGHTLGVDKTLKAPETGDLYHLGIDPKSKRN